MTDPMVSVYHEYDHKIEWLYAISTTKWLDVE